MQTKQYRLVKTLPHGTAKPFYRVLVTHGLMDTEYIAGGRAFPKQAEARQAAKAHAERTGVTPIILT